MFQCTRGRCGMLSRNRCLLFVDILVYFFSLVIMRLQLLLPAALVGYIGLSMIFSSWKYSAVSVVTSCSTFRHVEIQGAMLSSLFTVASVLISVLYATAHWKREARTKQNVDIATKIVSIMHDMSVCVSDITYFVKETRDFLVEVDELGFDALHWKYSYWGDRRKHISGVEQQLWLHLHEFNRWCNVGRGAILASGVNQTTMKISQIVANIKIKSSMYQIYVSGESTPDVDEVFNNINMYCIDWFHEHCEQSSVYISANTGFINQKLTEQIKYHTFSQLWLMVKLLPSADDLVSAMKTGKVRDQKRLFGVFNIDI